jgi:hypothetical protein
MLKEIENVPAPQKELLDSWKEIAVFLNRGVRTVQRWEREENLPIHRHQHRKRGSVFAFASEISAWLQVREGRPQVFQIPVLTDDRAIAGTGSPRLESSSLAVMSYIARVRAQQMIGRLRASLDDLSRTVSLVQSARREFQPRWGELLNRPEPAREISQRR